MATDWLVNAACSFIGVGSGHKLDGYVVTLFFHK